MKLSNALAISATVAGVYAQDNTTTHSGVTSVGPLNTTSSVVPVTTSMNISSIATETNVTSIVPPTSITQGAAAHVAGSLFTAVGLFVLALV